jgi:predicted O-linked N-acetylglucosamine transferase (SPINDLY family)
MATISEALAIAVQHHQAGRLQAAEQIYRQVLAVEPKQADAWHLLGVVAHQMGKHEVAVGYIRRAIQLTGTEAAFHVNLGNALNSQGKLDEAIVCFRHALGLKPDFVEAHNNLGTALQEQGRLDEAVACYRRAIEFDPRYAEAYNNLGSVLKDQGSLDEAVACYRRAMELKPDLAEAYSNLGVVLQDQGKLDEAVACHRRALELKPDFARAHNDLGVTLNKQGKLDEAVACFRQALKLKPDFAQAHNNLGAALDDQGKLDEAVACYRRALELKPDYAEAHNDLGVALNSQGKLNDAVACFRQALKLKPDFAQAHNNLGAVLDDQGKLDDAVACFRQALELKPDFAWAHNNLGNTLKDQGNLDKAVACYRRAVELKPDFVWAHSNLVFGQVFCPGCEAETLYEEHRRWNRQHAEPLAKFIQPHLNDRSPDRRLRIGYVSPDFRNHPVGLFLLPLLESHDHESFEISCYASVRIPDTMTGRCRVHADVWRDVLGLSDERLANTIRQDQTDILVDLTMHAGNHRLLVFARKPAPVQVTYLAYCGTTGLSTMDYRLTDPYLDPPGQDERFYCEQSVRLPETYWCYQPVIETPPVNTLPALKGGPFTFGCLNNFCKVTPPALAAWSRLLQVMPDARLLLYARAGSHRDRVRGVLAERGISSERLAFVDFLPLEEYFGVYQQIDVALDTFPYGGGTTTCDALWMGVPVVSLAGQTAVGRGGVSILSNVGLPELVAHDAEQYVRIAVDLANDLPRLSQLRATLRNRMQASPLMNAPRFARNVEAAYREMWRRWCAKYGAL